MKLNEIVSYGGDFCCQCVLEFTLTNVEQEIKNTADQIKNINTYNKYKSIYTSYQNSTDKDAYLRMHESKIILFEAARVALDIIDSKQPKASIAMLKNQIQKLTVESEKLIIQQKELKQKITEVNQLKNNLKIYLKGQSIPEQIDR